MLIKYSAGGIWLNNASYDHYYLSRSQTGIELGHPPCPPKNNPKVNEHAPEWQTILTEFMFFTLGK
jgi:hypothetical protein